MKLSKLLTVFACLALVAGSVLAQDQQPGQGRRGGGFGGGFGGFGGGGFGGGGGMFGADNGLLSYVTNEEVQKEIEALDDQIADLKKISEEQQAAMRAQFESAPRVDFQSLSEEERTKQFAEMRERMTKQTEETNAKVEEILLPNQVKRIKEIMIQRQGIRALNNPEVVAELELTDEQKEKLKTVNEENGQAMQKAFAEMRNAGEGAEVDREAMGKKFEELRKTSEENVLAVLTDEQKTEFETMKGEKFAALDTAFRRGGGFGGGGGGFGGGRRGGGGGPGGPGGRPGGRPGSERPAAENQ